MLQVVKFKASDVLKIKMQEKQAIELSDLKYEYYSAAEKLRHSYTILIGGVPMACVGIAEYWKNRGEVWAIIDAQSGKHFVRIIRAMKRLLDIAGCERIEATIQKDFKQAHRLARLLGFELEAETMRKYGVTGLDYSLYARVK
jgi:hypothetical protein